MLSNYRWYRRLRGGKWERWYIDAPVHSDMWFRVEDFGHRPGLARGTPEQEDYTTRP